MSAPVDAVVASAARFEERTGDGGIGRRAFFFTSALLFAAGTSATILGCESMSAMGGMPMAGGWTMSMLWMRMPGQTWLGAGAAFLGMWSVMMVAMMLPSLVPALWGYVEGRAGPGRLALLMGAGYFSVWIVLGIAVFLLGNLLAALEMRRPELADAVPIMAGVVVVAAGALQFTAWKARHLALCRQIPCSSVAPRGRNMPGHGRPPSENVVPALLRGLRLGLHCSLSSAGLTAILLVLGMMDLRVMVAVTAAITIERLAPSGHRVARALGAVAVGAGWLLIISAA